MKRKIAKLVVKKANAQGFRETTTGTAGIAGGVVFKPLNQLTVTEIRDFIITSLWIDVCVSTIADEVVKYKLQTGPQNKEIDSWLSYPSDVDPLFIIRKKYIKDMLRYGNGFVTVEFKGNKPNRLVPIAGYLVRPTTDDPPLYKILKMDKGSYSEGIYVKQTDKEGNVIKNEKGQEIDLILSNKEGILFSIDADSDTALARSPLKKIYNYLKSDDYLSTKLADFTSRGLLTPAFLSGEKINDKDFTRFLEWLNGQIEEGAKFFGVNKKVTVSNLPHWSADDIIRMFRWIGLCVANVFKVPPFMLNLIEDTGSLNAREQKQRFLENVVQPIINYECHLYTLILLRKGFKEMNTEITCEALGTRLNWDKARIARMLYPEGEIFTQDEVRKFFFGLDPIKPKKQDVPDVFPSL